MKRKEEGRRGEEGVGVMRFQKKKKRMFVYDVQLKT
jgi:hypothetical protein